MPETSPHASGPASSPAPPHGRATTASRVLALDAHTAFRRLTALANHERLIPFTTIEAPNRAPRSGDTIVATSLGVLRDVMIITDFQPPTAHHAGWATYAKLGPLLLGSSTITVTPLAPTSCHVAWLEEVRFAAPFAFLSRPATPLLHAMTSLALRRFAQLSRTDSDPRNNLTM